MIGMKIAARLNNAAARKHRLALLALSSLAISTVAFAQSIDKPGVPDITPDELGVNLTSGDAVLPDVTLSIGDAGSGSLMYKGHRANSQDTARGSSGVFTWYTQENSNDVEGVSFGEIAKRYEKIAGVYRPDILDGSTYTWDNTNFSHTASDGTVTSSNYSCRSSQGVSTDIGTIFPLSVNASDVIKPNGERIKYDYLRVNDNNGCVKISRLQSITNNFGYQLKFAYVSDDVSKFDWNMIASVTAINNGVEYCNPLSNACTFANDWRKVSFTNTAVGYDNVLPKGVISGAGGEVITIAGSSSPAGLFTTILRGGIETVKYEFDFGVGNIFVKRATQAGREWQYQWSTNAGITRITRTDANSSTRIVDTQPYYGLIQSIKNENNSTSKYLYNVNNLLQYVVTPEGSLDGNGNPISGYVKYDYDTRGNLIQTTIVPKAGSGLPNSVTSAAFESPSCSNPKTCNQPVWKKDAKGNQTDYTYASTHGGMLSEMRPAPSAGAARPLKLVAYAQRSAWIMNASGARVQSPDPVWLIASSIECQTVAGGNTPVCDGAAPQTTTTYQYGASGTAEAMLVKGVAVASAGTTLRTCYGYDIFHRRISDTKANANLTSCP